MEHLTLEFLSQDIEALLEGMVYVYDADTGFVERNMGYAVTR